MARWSSKVVQAVGHAALGHVNLCLAVLNVASLAVQARAHQGEAVEAAGIDAVKVVDYEGNDVVQVCQGGLRWVFWVSCSAA